MTTPHDPVVVQILEECLSIHKKRHKQYGFCHDNFAAIAEAATKLSHTEHQFTALDIAIVMVSTKEARYNFQQKHGLDVHDSLIDWINYIAIMESLRQGNEHTQD